MKKRMIGVVTSDKCNKTRRVEVERLYRHPKYGKTVRSRTICHVHDEENTAKEGDTVEIVEIAAPFQDETLATAAGRQIRHHGAPRRRGSGPMIQMQTIVDVADNTGAKTARCIKVLGGSRRRTAGLGDVIVVSVQKSIPSATVKKGTVAKGVIVRCRQADAAAGRQLCPLRPQCRRADRRRRQSAGHAHFRGGGPRATRPQVHQDPESGE